MLEYLQYLSIIVEAVVAIIGAMIYFQKKKKYGIGIFVTFGIYVLYDLAKQIGLSINSDVLYLLFFIATLSALYAVYIIYKENKNKK